MKNIIFTYLFLFIGYFGFSQNTDCKEYFDTKERMSKAVDIYKTNGDILTLYFIGEHQYLLMSMFDEVTCVKKGTEIYFTVTDGKTVKVKNTQDINCEGNIKVAFDRYKNINIQSLSNLKNNIVHEIILQSVTGDLVVYKLSPENKLDLYNIIQCLP
jgi:hypothetical protein